MDLHKRRNEDIEIQLLLEAIYLKYGYDFRNYAKPSLTRRIKVQLAEYRISSISALQNRILHDTVFFETLLEKLSVNVTSMFRNPSFYRAVREILVPALRNEQHLRIWCAGCATGEEAYSLAILLHECGLYERTQIYATDISEYALEKAVLGVYPLSRMKEYSHKYQLANSDASLTDYFATDNNSVIVRNHLKRNINFSDHNLGTDAGLSDINLVVCRNVLIYFDPAMREKVFESLFNSLIPGGYLGLGSKESAKFNARADEFHTVCGVEKLYQKSPTI